MAPLSLRSPRADLSPPLSLWLPFAFAKAWPSSLPSPPLCACSLHSASSEARRLASACSLFFKSRSSEHGRHLFSPVTFLTLALPFCYFRGLFCFRWLKIDHSAGRARNLPRFWMRAALRLASGMGGAFLPSLFHSPLSFPPSFRPGCVRLMPFDLSVRTTSPCVPCRRLP